MPARPNRLGRLPRTPYIFDNLPKLSASSYRRGPGSERRRPIPAVPVESRLLLHSRPGNIGSGRDTIGPSDLAGSRHQERPPRGWQCAGRLRHLPRQPRGKRWMAYLRTSWTRGFLPLQTYRGRSDRAFRSLDRLVSFLREDFRYEGEISLFMPGDPGLERFRILLPTDRAALDGAGRRPPAEGLVTRKPRTG